MSYTIALAGKGGTGKTTMAGLLIRYMVEKGIKARIWPWMPMPMPI